MRNAAFLAVGILLIIVQGNLYRLLAPLGGIAHGATPSLTVPLIVYLGVHEPSLVRGAALSSALGYCLDLLGAAPVGLFAFTSVVILILSRLIGVRLTAQTLITRMTLAFGFALIETLIVFVLIAVFGQDPLRPLEFGSIALPHAIGTALVGPWLFRLAQRLQQGGMPVNAAAAEGAAR
jgi:rod shape-determining protein MreD